MSFVSKLWKNRESQYPTRRILTDTTTGTTQTVTVERNEGNVTEEGDSFDANTMNNLEARIGSAFTQADAKMGDLADLETTDKSSLVNAINEAAQGGGGGGSSTLAGLNDVDLATPANGQVLKYNSTSQKWENANESGGGGSTEHALTFTYSTPLQYSQITDKNDFTYVSTVDETGATVAAADVYDLLLAGYNAYMKLIIYAGDVNEQVYTINLGKKMYVGNGAGAIMLNFAYADESSCFTISTSLETHGDDATASDFYFTFYFIAYPDEARNVLYDAGMSGLQASNVNDAIDELASEKADTTSPALTGTPTAPTPTAGDDSTKIATTAFIQDAIESATQFKVNEELALTGGIYAGSITGGSKNVYFFIPLPKKTDNVTNVTVSGIWYIRGVSGHILSNATLASAGTVTPSLVAGGVQILLEMSTAHSTLTNTPLTALAWTNAKLKFT